MPLTHRSEHRPLRHDGLPSWRVVVLALLTALLLLEWRPSFLRPLTWWVAEAFGV